MIQILKAIARIANSGDGKILLDYLESLSNKAIKDMKYCEPFVREMNAGRAQMIGEIIDFIIKAESKCREQTKDNPTEWSL